MPRYKPATAERKAKSLVKTCIENGLNENRIAKKLGISQQAVNQRLNRAPVQKTLQEVIDKNLRQAGISQRKVYKRLDEELDATRTISAVISPDGKQKDANGQTCDFVEVIDYGARDKAIDKTLTLMGHLKHNGKGDVIANITNILNLKNYPEIDPATRRRILDRVGTGRSEV